MPIKNLTRHNQTPGLARAGVIRLGYKARKCQHKKCGHISGPLETGPTCAKCGQALPDSTFPRESAHFILSDAPGVAQAIGTETPTELQVYFPFDEVEAIFPHYMQLWAASALRCRGDGENILHAIDPTTGRAIVHDGIALADFSEGGRQFVAGEVMRCPGLNRDLYPKCQHCKPGAILVVMLRKVPRLAYFQITTTSINNILNLADQLTYVRSQVQRLTGQARLTGVPFILRRVKKSVSVPNLDRDGKPKIVNGKPLPRQRIDKYFLELEIEPEWIVKLVQAQARLADPLGQVAGALPALVTESAPPAARYDEPLQWEPRPEFDDDDAPIEGELVEDEPPTVAQEPPAIELAAPVQSFFEQVQAATGNYYKNPPHLFNTIRGWPNFNKPDEVAAKLSAAVDHARQKGSESTAVQFALDMAAPAEVPENYYSEGQ